jgi:hypothetical protein
LRESGAAAFEAWPRAGPSFGSRDKLRRVRLFDLAGNST